MIYRYICPRARSIIAPSPFSEFLDRGSSLVARTRRKAAAAHGAPPAPNLPACLHARAIIHAHPAPHREPLGERDEDTFIRASDPCDVVISVCGL